MEIKEKIKNFISDNFMVELDNNLSDDDSLLDKGIIDSTGVLELILFIEENFKIKIKDEEIVPENLDSFNKIDMFLSKKLASN